MTYLCGKHQRLYLCDVTREDSDAAVVCVGTRYSGYHYIESTSQILSNKRFHSLLPANVKIMQNLEPIFLS